jgi:hypothetical protein
MILTVGQDRVTLTFAVLNSPWHDNSSDLWPTPSVKYTVYGDLVARTPVGEPESDRCLLVILDSSDIRPLTHSEREAHGAWWPGSPVGETENDCRLLVILDSSDLWPTLSDVRRTYTLTAASSFSGRKWNWKQPLLYCNTAWCSIRQTFDPLRVWNIQCMVTW